MMAPGARCRHGCRRGRPHDGAGSTGRDPPCPGAKGCIPHRRYDQRRDRSRRAHHQAVKGLLFPFVAVMAGVISFSSPCCLPLLPGYLSYVSALPVSELGDRQARMLTLRAALLFVAGFTVVFTVLGVLAQLLGSVFLSNGGPVVRWFGLPIIVLGLSTMGVLRIPFLMRERRIDLARVPRGTVWAFPMGMAFAAGWAPCLGPVL